MCPAEPILASTLLNDEDLDALLEGLIDVGAKKRIGLERRGDTLGTGVREVDDVLGGGLRAGRMVGVSGEGGELSLALLTASLLTSPTSLAAIIDSTGNLDVIRIYSLLLTRLCKNDLLRAQQASTDTSNLSPEDVAAKVLERVKIMRVFDLEGVIEAVEELKEGFGGSIKEVRSGEEQKSSEEKEAGEQEKKPVPVLRKTVIPDSEDEDDEDEMLLEAPVITTDAASPQKGQTEAEHPSPPEEKEEAVSEGKVTFILIDNLAHVLNPLLKNDYAQATAQCTSLLRTLAALTRTHNLHTLLLNPAPLPTSRPTAPPSTTNTSHPHTNPHVHIPQPQPTPQTSKPHPPKPPSIFASTHNLPALSHVLPRYLDLHLLISSLPNSKADARVVHADGGTGRGMRRGIGMQTVVEVLADRWRKGVGAWGVLKEGVMDGSEERKERSDETSGKKSAWGVSWEVVRG